jgi:transposase
MKMKLPSRSQRMLLPPSIDEFVGPDHRVRVVVEVVERLDLSAFDEGDAGTGRPRLPPEALISVLLYAFSIGVFSSREIARRVETDCAFMYATAGLRPSYRTLSRFRREHETTLSGVFAQVVVVCQRAGLGGPEVVVIDGTKQRANASLDAHERRSHLEKQLSAARSQVAKLLEEAARVDDAEDATEPDTPKLGPAQERVAAIEVALEEMKAAGLSERNTTDPDARIQSLKEGRRPGYNAQIAVSGADGLILAGDVTSHGDDTSQLLPLREQVLDNTGESPGTLVADAGYESGPNVRALVEADQDAVIACAAAKSAHVRKRKTGRFQWPDLEYDARSDAYVCPAGRRLERISTKYLADGRAAGRYRGIDCDSCPLRSQCVKGTKPREFQLLETTPYLLAMSERRAVDRATKNLMARRSTWIEGHFGHFKHNLGWRHFWHRGLAAAKAEFLLLCTAYNIGKLARMRPGWVSAAG